MRKKKISWCKSVIPCIIGVAASWDPNCHGSAASQGEIVSNSHSRTIISFGSFFDCSAPPKKKGDLFLLSQFRKTEIAGWVGFTKPSQERHGSLWALLELSQAWIELSKDWLPKKERSLTAHFLYLYGLWTVTEQLVCFLSCQPLGYHSSSLVLWWRGTDLMTMRIGTERLQLHLPEAISINWFSTSLIEHLKEVNQVRLLSGYISRWTEWGGLLIERCWNARDRRHSSEWQAWVWTWSISLVSQSPLSLKGRKKLREKSIRASNSEIMSSSYDYEQ